MYGLHEALAMIKQEGSVILCEGYFDVIALYRSVKGMPVHRWVRVSHMNRPGF